MKTEAQLNAESKSEKISTDVHDSVCDVDRKSHTIYDFDDYGCDSDTTESGEHEHNDGRRVNSSSHSKDMDEFDNYGDDSSTSESGKLEISDVW